ncbi:putative signal peptide and transmembrane protein [Rhodopirellula islandica]|uniref:Signal peptide and transmembrane protein n=1 Tax=Rhodopirellula islandica TaxID=595434 RepID=A0A0J1B421_RHOIS|nr:hypothetical protein [Rhodopirellula islandica]KLU01497.1 putative signal peptide and transmembrane protein [Rhodopirellula islandica]
MKATKTFFALLVFAGTFSVMGCAPDDSTTQIEPPAEFSYDDSSYEQEMDAATDAQQD